MSSSPTPKVTRAPSLPLVWIVPLLAVAVGGWMLLRDLRNRGPEVKIEFADGTGVEADKTSLVYKGVAVGTVKAVALGPDLGGVVVTVRIIKEAKALANAGGKFWIVHPEIGFSGVHGLDTLITGVHLSVRPGQGATAERFRGLDEPPPPEIPDQGRIFVLESDRLGSLTTGSPVFYRQFKVGMVETSRLSDDSTRVLIRIHIEAPYVDLVRTNTHFWNAGGFTFKLSLLGAELKNNSLESLVAGGVAFATSDQEPLAPVAADGASFPLTADPDKSWLKWEPKIPVKSPESTLSTKPGNDALHELIKP